MEPTADPPTGLARQLRALAISRRFQRGVIGIIFLSVILVGLESIPGIPEAVRNALDWLERAVLLLFVVELAIRIGAEGARPWRFFVKPWNLLDFLIIAVCFLPAAGPAVVFRLVRLLRVLRLVAPIHESEVIRRKNEELAAANLALSLEREKSERLLLNVLPVLIAQRLKHDPKVIADRFEDASVLFGDLVGFTKLSRHTSAEEMVAMLDEVFSRFDHLAGEHGLEKIKTIGDAYMVVAGVPEVRADHAAAAARMALDMIRALAEFNQQTGKHLQLRIGLHAGPVVAGVIGRKKFIFDLWGETVNTASRMESHGVPDRIHVTEEFSRRLAAEFTFEARGEMEVKGIGSMTTFFLTGKK